MINVNNIILSEEQSKPIIDNPEFSIIIAGAGSGKSLTMVGKIKYMLDNNLIKDNEICAITYTNKAVNSLQEKIMNATSKTIDVFTFHKLAINILKKANYDYQIVSEYYLDELIDEYFNTNAFYNEILMKIIYKYFKLYIFKKIRYKKLLCSKKYLELKKIIKCFIYYMNSNELSYKWNEIIKNKKYQNILLIIYSLYTIYMNELSSSNLIDFDFMIKKASELINNNKVKLPYKLIIIDEFQDTSKSRFNLIQSIVNKNKSKLCVVGDDYQSIYQFQGCDINLFLNFKKYFNNVNVYYLNETYRNSLELINIAGNFINKNDKQIKKNLISKKHLNNPIKIIKYFNEKSVLKHILDEIPLNKEILILSRNNFDIKKYVNNYELINSELKIKEDNHFIKYMTIHSSKGLESDVVIVLNMCDDIYGLPSKIKGNEVLDLLKDNNDYLYAEERRLFYVALTRTKSYVYLLCPYFLESIFVKEIKKDLVLD